MSTYTAAAFTLWGPQEVNGTRRWGVNERRPYGVYTVGPRDGFETRREACDLLKKLRVARRDAAVADHACQAAVNAVRRAKAAADALADAAAEA